MSCCPGVMLGLPGGFSSPLASARGRVEGLGSRGLSRVEGSFFAYE